MSFIHVHTLSVSKLICDEFVAIVQPRALVQICQTPSYICILFGGSLATPGAVIARWRHLRALQALAPSKRLPFVFPSVPRVKTTILYISQRFGMRSVLLLVQRHRQPRPD
eukprot:503071_1